MNKKVIKTKGKTKFHTTIQFNRKPTKPHYVVINVCYGGFGLSEAARQALAKLGLKLDDEWDWAYNIERHNPLLVKVVKKLGQKAAAELAELKVVKLSGDKYRINEYDGWEYVEEPQTVQWTVIRDN